MKKYSVGFILIEILVMLVISILPTVVVGLCTDSDKNLTIPAFIVFLFFSFILHTALANRILFPIAKKTMEKCSDREEFVKSIVLYNRQPKADSFRDAVLKLQQKQNVPFPSTNHLIKTPDMWSDIASDEIPKYLGDLAKKYNMHFKLATDIEMAMFNEKCCLIFGIDRADGVIIWITFLENGRRVEYEVDQYFTLKFDALDREGIDFEWNHMSEKIRNELLLIAHGLDSKWSSVLEGDMSWFEEFKRSCWCHEQHFYIEERNKILDEIIAWQQVQ